MKYIASIAAIQASSKGMLLGHKPVQIEALSLEKAEERALEDALMEWPKEKEWEGHSVAVEIIHDRTARR